MKRLLSLALLCAVATLAACATMDSTVPGKPEYMVVGIDNKTTWGAGGKLVLSAPGKDFSRDRRYRYRSRQPEDRHDACRCELDLRPADQPAQLRRTANSRL